MRRWFAAVAGVLLALVWAGAATARPEHTLTVINDTGSALTELYIATDQGGWPEDILGANILAPGERTVVEFPQAECHYYLKAVFADGGKLLRKDIDICTAPELRLGKLLADDLAAVSGTGNALPPPPAYGMQSTPDGAIEVGAPADSASEAPSEPMAAPAPVVPPPSLDRGVPICPGDVRCKKKP